MKDVSHQGPETTDYFDIVISEPSKDWFIEVPKSNRVYCVELGFLTFDGQYIFLLRS